jgi:hypothetical protein
MPEMNMRLLVSLCTDRTRQLSALAALLALTACNTPPALTGPAMAASAAPPASSAKANTALASPAAAAASRASASSSASAAPPTPGQPPAFALVIKDARKIDGLFTVWQKDEKVWFELSPTDFNKPLFLSPKIAQGIGEPGFYGGTMIGQRGRAGRAQLFEFRRVHNQVQMLAINSSYVARDGKSPEARSVADGFSHSLLGSSAVASQPHPDRKTILIDAGPLLLSDMLGLGANLQRVYRQNYALDSRHTQFSSVRGMPDGVVFNVNAHFYNANLATAQPGSSAGAPTPQAPQSLPDARSLFLGLYYAIVKMPDVPMAPRLADPRVGYFQTAVDDFSDDVARSPRQRYANRWRLNKKDPTAALSEPVKPITFWVDRSVPMKYRDSVLRAIEVWNLPFEKIGFKNAIVARIQPDDASFDTLDVGIASVRWINSAQPSFNGIGPSQVDPRSGEILDADILIDGNWARSRRGFRTELLGAASATADTELARRLQLPLQDGDFARRYDAGLRCEDAQQSAEQLAYGLEVLETRSPLDPDSPEAERFTQAAVFSTVMHEVGHALGLRHNFRASRAYSLAQLADPAFTAAHGIAASVMDYPGLNLPPPGVAFDRHGAPFRAALGPYDYWAIEHGYRPFAAADEARELQRIAARSGEAGLGYGTDEDVWLGIDAETLQWDLGDDPVAYAKSRMAIASDLLAKQASRVLRSDEDYSVLRRAVGYAIGDMTRAAGVLARQIGGLRTLRDFPGNGREPMQPVPATVQRQALSLLAEQVLSGSLRLSPALQRRLAPDYQARYDALNAGASQVATEYSLDAAVLQLQRTVLGQLMSDGLAARLIDNEARTDLGADALRLHEVYGQVGRSIWTELSGSNEIAPARRELQREHVNRMATLLLRPAALTRADARGLLREEALRLLPQLHAAAGRKGLTAETRAHLNDSADSLRSALAAPLQRQGS